MKSQIVFLLVLFLFVFASRSGMSDTSSKPVINEYMSSSAVGGNVIHDEDNEYNDWIELFNPGTTQINLAGYGLSDRASNPYKWVFPSYILGPGKHLLVFASGKDRKDIITHWETVINKGDQWRYFIGDSEPPQNWNSEGFNDSSWLSGSSDFGYGYSGIATVLTKKTASFYIRTSFTVEDTAKVNTCFLHIDYDDAFVAYLNGVEIARANVGTPGKPPTYKTVASSTHKALMYTGGAPQENEIKDIRGLLKQGHNILAIQVHNYYATDATLAVTPFLTFGMTEPPNGFRGISSFITVSENNYFHTNFKISSSGETLFITDSSGSVCDSIETGTIPYNTSRGRYPDGGFEWFLFTQPTPGKPNDTPGFIEFAGSTTASVRGGFYDSGLSVTLSTSSSSGAIHYTLDGSEPIDKSPGYTSPISITKTSVLRARVLAPDLLPGKITTQTYFINEHSTLPVFSIATDPGNLFNDTIGIYVKKNQYKDWERPIHIEMYETDKTLAFSADAGATLTGGACRGYDQKSLAIFFRTKYGPDEIIHQLFPGKPMKRFTSFVLRNAGNDWSLAFIRDGLAATLISDMDVDYEAYRPSIVFINGQYWGIHEIREKKNEDFIATHHNVDPDNLDIVDPCNYLSETGTWIYSQGVPRVSEGDADHYTEMMDFVANHDMSVPENYEHIKTLLDIPGYIDFYVAGFLLGRCDWPGRNMKLWRPRTSDGKWRCLFFDADCSFDINANSKPNFNTFNLVASTANYDQGRNPPWSTLLLRKLLENQSFRIDFSNRIGDCENTIFQPSIVVETIRRLKAVLAPEIPRHIQKWPVMGSAAAWSNRVDALENFANTRPSYLRSIITSQFSLSGTATVTLDVFPQGTGTIKLNALTIHEFPWNGVYFKDIPIHIAAQPALGYEFVEWRGIPTSDSTFVLTGDTPVTAVFKKIGVSSRVVINEINYNSAADFNPGDWVELHNAWGIPADISGWVVKDNDDTHGFVIPENTVIESGGYLVLCENTESFSALFPATQKYIGNLGFGLGSKSDAVRIFDSAGNIVDSLTYSNDPPWPVHANGNGYTLSLVDPVRDNSIAGNWSATRLHGTPGERNIQPMQTSIIINEINYNSSKEFDPDDWVEFHNPTDVQLSLSEWIFKDSDNTHTFMFPKGTVIEPRGFLVLCKNASLFHACFPAVSAYIGDLPFGFGKSELLRLINDRGEMIDSLTYSNIAPWPVEADGGGYTLALRHPYLDNSLPDNWVADAMHGTPGTNGINTEVQETQIPQEFTLGQNYPNPFNESTTIPFSVPRAGRVTLEVYSIVGQLVATLFDRNTLPGSYTVNFNVKDLSSGLYISVLKAPGSFHTQRMLYLK